MKRLILLILLITCSNVFAVTTFTRKDGSVGLRYHHTLKIESRTYYCNKEGDCRTYVDWVNNETPESRKRSKILARVAERKAISNVTGSSEKQKRIVWLTQEEWKKNQASILKLECDQAFYGFNCYNYKENTIYKVFSSDETLTKGSE